MLFCWRLTSLYLSSLPFKDVIFILNKEISRIEFMSDKAFRTVLGIWNYAILFISINSLSVHHSPHITYSLNAKIKKRVALDVTKLVTLLMLDVTLVTLCMLDVTKMWFIWWCLIPLLSPNLICIFQYLITFYIKFMCIDRYL